MCYGCSPTCDNCRPKVLHCPSCETVNYLSKSTCVSCGREFTQEVKDQAIAKWRAGERILSKAEAGPPEFARKLKIQRAKKSE